MKTLKSLTATACYTLAIACLLLPIILAVFQAWNHCQPTDTFRVVGWVIVLAFAGAPLAIGFAEIADHLTFE